MIYAYPVQQPEQICMIDLNYSNQVKRLGLFLF